MKSVLIIGGGGFIGVSIARQLLETGGYRVSLVDNFSRGSERVDLLRKDRPDELLQIVNADLTDPEEFNKLETDCRSLMFLQICVKMQYA